MIMNNISKYDAILVCDVNDFIMEAEGSFGDPRSYTGPSTGPSGKAGAKSGYFWYDDPKLYASNAFGRMMLQDLNSWKQGYSAKVTDFGKWVVVEVTYHHHVTGRSASKTFLVVFDGGPKGTDKGGGMILSTANKWRSISGYGQACSYIKSASGALESTTSQKL